MGQVSIFRENVGETFETPVGSDSRRCETGRNVRERGQKKAPSLANSKKQKVTKGREKWREKRMPRDRDKGEKGKERRRKGNCTKTRRCVAQLAGRDEGEKYPEGEILRVDGCASVCVRVCVCVCVETATTRDKEAAASEWHARKNERSTGNKSCPSDR